jgi:hypothetical protein
MAICCTYGVNDGGWHRGRFWKPGAWRVGKSGLGAEGVKFVIFLYLMVKLDKLHQCW